MTSFIPHGLINHLGECLDFSWHPADRGNAKIALIGHGVTGNKDRPLLIALAEALARSGISALRFSFSGNGESGGRFVDSTVTKEVEELGSVLDAFPRANVTYIGHSMGAAVGVLRASRDRRVSRLVSLAGMAHTAAFARREFGELKPGVDCMWDKPECPLSQDFMDDMERIGTVSSAARSVVVPWLLVHGLLDDVVPIQDSQDLYAVAGGPKQLKTIDGADHVFTGEATGQAVRCVVTWLTSGVGG